MKVREVLQQIRQVRVPRKGCPVEETVSKEFIHSLSTSAVIQPVDPLDMKSESGVFYIAVAAENLIKILSERGIKVPADKEWVYFSIDENQCCWMLGSSGIFIVNNISVNIHAWVLPTSK